MLNAYVSPLKTAAGGGAAGGDLQCPLHHPIPFYGGPSLEALGASAVWKPLACPVFLLRRTRGGQQHFLNSILLALLFRSTHSVSLFQIKGFFCPGSVNVHRFLSSFVWTCREPRRFGTVRVLEG